MQVEEIFCLSASDGGRDVLHFVESFMPTPASLQYLSLFGPQWYQKVLVRQGKGKAVKDRNVVVVGQSEAVIVPDVDRIIACSLGQTDIESSSWDTDVKRLNKRFASSKKNHKPFDLDDVLAELSTSSNSAGKSNALLKLDHLQYPEKAGEAIAALLQGRTQAEPTPPLFLAHL